jgi:hypothetical protein
MYLLIHHATNRFSQSIDPDAAEAQEHEQRPVVIEYRCGLPATHLKRVLRAYICDRGKIETSDVLEKAQ